MSGVKRGRPRRAAQLSARILSARFTMEEVRALERLQRSLGVRSLSEAIRKAVGFGLTKKEG